MGNYLSAFTIYEVLRIIIPGFYLTSMIYVVLTKCHNICDYCFDNDIILSVVYIVFSIFIGGGLYSIDYPRLFRSLLNDLPTNLMKKYNPELYRGKEDREIEEKYYNFYYELNNDSKTKTEIQSGFYHLFLSMSLVGLISFIILAFNCCYSGLNFYLWLNFIFIVLGLIFATLIYKVRLKYSWRRNYHEFIGSINNDNNKKT